MKKLLPLFFSFTVAFLISSCAVQPSQKRLIGTWKAVKVEPYNIPRKSSPTANNVKKTGNSYNDSTALKPEQKLPSKSELGLQMMIQSELHSTMTINADNTVVKEYPRKTIHATWKLTNKGKAISIDSKEIGKKMTFYILHINDTSVIITESLPSGSVKITYKKEKEGNSPQVH